MLIALLGLEEIRELLRRQKQKGELKAAQKVVSKYESQNCSEDKSIAALQRRH